MPLCDGCGANVDDAHIRSRIERLEMATRYRPIHIQVLILDAAPPARADDFFYHPGSDWSTRCPEGRSYFHALMRCAGEDSSRFSTEADALAEFQRRGLFLTNVVECAAGSDLDAALSRCTPSLLKRIQFSYKPKLVAPISHALQGSIRMFTDAGWADRLILSGSSPFDVRVPEQSEQLARAVNEKLAKAVSNSA